MDRWPFRCSIVSMPRHRIISKLYERITYRETDSVNPSAFSGSNRARALNGDLKVARSNLPVRPTHNSQSLSKLLTTVVRRRNMSPCDMS